MELCSYYTHHHLKPYTPPFRSKLKSKFFLSLKPNSIAGNNPGLRYYKFNPLKASNGSNQYVKEVPDVVTDNEAQSEDKSGFGEFNLFNDGDVGDDQFPRFDFLNKLKVELDLEDSFSISLLGVGGFTALWLTASIVAAIDHIPLLPKLMEVVGVGYTIWFSTRYLLFKKNRDELASKIEEIKQQVLGAKN